MKPCLICGDVPKGIIEDVEGDQPVGALMFSTYGHYGSGVFDPADGTQLEILICDKHVSEAGDAGRVALVQKATSTRYIRKVWHDDYNEPGVTDPA